MFGKFSIWQTKSEKCSIWKIETFKIRDSVLFMACVRFQVPPLQSLIVWLRFSANERVLCKPPLCVVFMGSLSSTTSTIFSVPLFTAHLAFENSVVQIGWLNAQETHLNLEHRRVFHPLWDDPNSGYQNIQQTFAEEQVLLLPLWCGTTNLTVQKIFNPSLEAEESFDVISFWDT